MPPVIGTAMSIGPEVDGVMIAAGIFGSVTVGTFIFYLMQIIKGFTGDRVQGVAAEAMVLIVSALAIVVALVSVGADWTDENTYVSLIIGTLGATVIARGVYAQLFKISVPGIPPPSESTATVVSDPKAETVIVTEPPRQEGIA